jgi:signal transduction histidine kinase
MLPAPRERVSRTSVLPVVVAALLALVTAGIALDEADPASPLRHLFAVPMVLGALAFGFPGALFTGAGVVLLFAPVVLPDVERHGLTAEVAEALVTMVLLLVLGVIVGSLRTRARRQSQRLALLVAMHQLVARDDEIEIVLRRVRALLLARLPLHDLALLLADGTCACATGEPAQPGSLAATVARSGAAVFLEDSGDRPRPCRVGAVPLTGTSGTVGALIVEADELSTADRADLLALGAYVGLALENARLAARQRRAADELDAKVAEATHHLEEMDRAKSTFVAIASHELRTPLTALLGFSHLLATRMFPVAEVQRLAGIVHRETERLVRLVDDLLDLSRLERGAAPTLRRTALCPASALSGVAEVFRHAGRRLVVECAPAVPAVDADPDAVDRILKNLISNALKYSPATARVHVAADRDGPGTVRFTVRDAGPGIPPAALPHVFEPYYRAPGAAGAAPGTGLGLAVVKALVEAHGGGIEVASEVGYGTAISFTLPCIGV